MNFIEFSYSDETMAFKESSTSSFLQIRSNFFIERSLISLMQGI